MPGTFHMNAFSAFISNDWVLYESSGEARSSSSRPMLEGKTNIDGVSTTADAPEKSPRIERAVLTLMAELLSITRVA